MLGSAIGMCTWTDTSISGALGILVSSLPETSQDVTYLEKVTKIRLNQINYHVSLIFQAHEKIQKYIGPKIKLTFRQKKKYLCSCCYFKEEDEGKDQLKNSSIVVMTGLPSLA